MATASIERMSTTDPLPVARRTRSWRFALAAVLLLLIGAGGFYWWQSRQAYHLATVQEGVLYRDGAKSVGQFSAAINRVHPKTVVSLVDEAESNDPTKPQFSEETKLCSAKGVRLEKIEVKLGGWPTSADIQRFLQVASDKQNQPVLVHCAQGVRRTAMFVAAYQESVLGYDKQRAKDSILTFGHSDRTINDIKRFIDQYDPHTRTIAGDLGQGKE